METRALEPFLLEDLAGKMVFLGGPRQVGKTTAARRLAGRFPRSVYLNWDAREHRRSMLSGQWPPETDLVILDELHKQPDWKSRLKGLWDTRPAGQSFLVTGSSRLDVFRRGGDSLMGRYHYWRLHPFSAAEMEGKPVFPAAFPKKPPVPEFGPISPHLQSLMRMGGFPEPLFSGSERTLNRWRSERLERLFRDDIRSVEAVQNLSKVELLAEMLALRAGTPLSINSLAADVEATNKTVKAWIDLLGRNYYLFAVPPWHRRIERALKKEAKHYLWDWSEVREEGPRFENLMASHLLKWCHFCRDAHGVQAELHYVRDREKREVDFLIVWDKTPWMLVECKLSAPDGLGSLRRFGHSLGVKERYLVTLAENRDYLDRESGVRVIPAVKFLLGLGA